MPKGVRYIDHSGQAIVQLAASLAVLAETAAEIIVEEIAREIEEGSPSGRFHYVKRHYRERDKAVRAARREWTMAARKAKKAGLAEPKRRRVLKYRLYQASAPGEAPARPTERYARSWHASVAFRRGGSVTALAYSKAKTASGASLAAALEYGEGRMAPRPHIEPALARARTRIAALTRGRQAAA